ncbi:type IV pilin protein [Noviherbaspirillum sp. ST9]|uniref:type IV pilin protein n=1 Tax=Noviherbaspirillum sp. ST9 TaxID=3401606 RepID=UPI003B5890ED
MNAALQNLKYRRGFTLIELMIAAAIVAILAAVAVPSYQQYIKRGKRAAAQAEMMDIANRQQQYFLDKRGYASKAEIESAGYALPTEVSAKYTYDIAVSSSGTPAFTITFTPTGSQADDGALTLNNAGVKTPADKWK